MIEDTKEILSLAKRLADYVRLTIETGGLTSESPIGIAYHDFIEEWDKKNIELYLNKTAKDWCDICGADIYE